MLIWSDIGSFLATQTYILIPSLSWVLDDDYQYLQMVILQFQTFQENANLLASQLATDPIESLVLS